jgi:hypothetical protein
MTTATVQSEIEVCNLALDMLKEAPITSMDENRSAARWMKRNFVPIRNYVTVSYIWKFAMKRAKLAEDPTPPEFEWRRRFRKPNDCLRVLHLRAGGYMNGILIPHQVEGDFILTNAPAPLLIRYLSVMPDPATWPPAFVDAVAAKLAERAAHFLTGKQAMVELAAARYREAAGLAASLDSAEGSHADQYATDYDAARYYAPFSEY